MTKLVITRGLPGSGKSTWAEAEAAETNSYAISRDELRFIIHNKYWGLSNDEENNITKVQRDLVKVHLKYQDVYVHDTALPDKVCREWRDLADDAGADFIIKDFRDVPLETCQQRVSARYLAGGRGVPSDVIDSMYARQIKGRKLSQPLAPRTAPVADVEVKQYVPDTSLPKAIIVDVDGTVANHVGVRGPYDTSKYHLDTVHEPVAEIVRALAKHYIVLVTSGRDAAFRAATHEWFAYNDIPFDKTIMRKEGDTRNDAIVKLELFWEHIAPFYNVVAALDDRDRVVLAWRSIGLTCLQVRPGDF